MEDKEKICANCKNFKWFYFKHKYKLNQSNCGRCFKKKILSEEMGACRNRKRNSGYRRSINADGKAH